MNTSFEKAKQGKIEWLTPPDLVKKLGEFDLAPVALLTRPLCMLKQIIQLKIMD